VREVYLVSVLDERDALRSQLAAAIERAHQLDIRRRESRQLLQRMVKYVREDKAVTPRATRLERLTEQVADYLERTHDPNDILRGLLPGSEGAGR
jgi:hypothetical protein